MLPPVFPFTSSRGSINRLILRPDLDWASAASLTLQARSVPKAGISAQPSLLRTGPVIAENVAPLISRFGICKR